LPKSGRDAVSDAFGIAACFFKVEREIVMAAHLAGRNPRKNLRLYQIIYQ